MDTRRFKLGVRPRVVQVLFGILLLEGSNFPKGVLANENNDSHYSIIEEHQNCDHIIPRFISQVMNHKASICQEQGAFPQPGNCTVFFKCVQSEKTIQPFVEYCSVGYNFVGGACLPNTNSSDCPQYTCRISDGANDFGNDLTSNNDEEHISGSASSYETISFATSQTTVSSSPVSTEKPEESTPDTVVGDTPSTTEAVQRIHSEQLQSIQGTEMQENKGSSLLLSHALLHFAVLFLAQFIFS